jgi:FeS assembly SUF system regulator
LSCIDGHPDDDMLRIARLTDYGTVVLAHMAGAPTRIHTAAGIAQETRLGVATVSKLLKLLTRAGLLVSYRGAAGGYALARAPEAISAADILDALEGPVALTECSTDMPCELESVCRVGSAWQRVNAGIRRALEAVSLHDLQSPDLEFPVPAAHRKDGASVRPGA